MNGIDISYYQKNIDLFNIDFDFCIVKATEGKTEQNPCFHEHIRQVRQLGKCIGFYHFARPENNTVQEEIQNFYSMVKNYIGQGIIFLDWESKAKYNTTWAKQWLDSFYKLTGVKPIIYMSVLSCEHAYDWSDVAKDYKLWMAKYKDYGIDYNYDMSNAGSKPVPKYWKDYVMWQWTSVGRLDGYSANLDCNKFYGTQEDWQKLCEREVTPMPEYKYFEVLNGVNQYSKKELGDCFFTIDGRVSNFQIKEFACKDGSDSILIDGELVRRLQDCRDKFGVTVINSAYRTPEWNKKVGGATNSQHVQGRASDTVCRGTTPLEVAMYVEALGMGGIGLYNDFTHIDTRQGKARWDSRSGREVGVATFLKTVKLLSTGAEVKIAQKYLGVKVDGIFGPATRKATIEFQNLHNLDDDGIIGKLTWTKLLTQRL